MVTHEERTLPEVREANRRWGLVLTATITLMFLLAYATRRILFHVVFK